MGRLGTCLVLSDAGDVGAAAGPLQAGLDDADRLDDGAGLAALPDGKDVSEAAGELGEEARREQLGRGRPGVEAEDV